MKNEQSLLWSTEGTTEAQRREWELVDDVAERIVKLMNGMTQEELARRSGKHKSVISRILGGGVNLTLRTITELEAALGGHIIEVPDYCIDSHDEPEAPAKAENSSAQNELRVTLPSFLRTQLEAAAEKEGVSVENLALTYLATMSARSRHDRYEQISSNLGTPHIITLLYGSSSVKQDFWRVLTSKMTEPTVKQRQGREISRSTIDEAGEINLDTASSSPTFVLPIPTKKEQTTPSTTVDEPETIYTSDISY